jgi:hypothetical protein
MALFALTVKRSYFSGEAQVSYSQGYLIIARDHLHAAKEVAAFANNSEVTWMSPEELVKKSQDWAAIFTKNYLA